MSRPGVDPPPSHLTDLEVAQLREAQLRGILGSAGEGILTIDGGQTIVMANRAAADMFGRTVAGLVGAPLSLLIPPRLRQAHAAQVAAFGAGDPPPRRMGVAAGVVGLRADGTEFPLEAGISVAHVDGTRLSTVILRDLSETQRAEQDLHARVARQTFLVQLNDRLRALRDPPAIATEATRMLGEFAGVARVAYAEDDGNGLTCTFVCGHARGVPPIQGVHPLADYGEGMRTELRAGRTAVIDDVATSPLLDAQDRQRRAGLGIAAVVSVPVHGSMRRAALLVHDRVPRHWTPQDVELFEDVAQRLRSDIDRARAAAEARATREMLQAALASMSDSVYITDVDGRGIARNRAFDAFHRFADPQQAPVELQRWPEVLEILQPDGTVAPLGRWPVVRALAGETVRNEELVVRRRDTGEQWVGSYSFAPVRNATGQTIGAVVVGRDVSDLKRMHDELDAAHADLQRLLAEQDRVQDQERLRIARELHDDLLQSQAAILLETSRVRGRLPASGLPADQGLARIESLAAQSITAARRLIHDLRPQALDELGLVAALVDLGARFTERSSVTCHVDAPELDNGTAARLAPLSASLYRIAQEALTNVAKHAGAHRVEVTIALLPGTPERVNLRVRDDGVGMRTDGERRADAFGLLGVRERVRAAGGTVTIDSAPDAGTTLTVELPLPDDSL